MKDALKLLLAAGAIVALAACNTVQGIGEDITAAGKGVQDEITGENDDDGDT